nr:uncharacterized mitochondrial protein AtMg00810-like [Tanacetum cinerariifolium]GEX21674.1 uncharacterized mitochondrial protein AtMg00810-like [Tanacetum cinerariifolium]
MNKVKKFKFFEPLTSLSNIKQVESSKTSDSNTPVLSSIGLKCSTSTCKSQPTGNKKNDKISQKPSSNRKNIVKAQPRKVNKKNHVKEPICDDNVKHTMLNANSQLTHVKCKQCMFDANHDVRFLDFVDDLNMYAKSKSKSKKSQARNIWKPTGKVFIDVGLNWKPTGRFFTIVGNSCPLTRFTPKKIVHLKEITSNLVETPKPEIKVYSRRPKQINSIGNRSQLMNFVSKFLGTVRFENDQVAKIIRYGDDQLGNVIILRVYYVEGLGYNLFSVGQFCDADLEVAFSKNTCFIRNLEGVDLLSGSRDTNLYIISLNDMLKTYSIFLLSKASKTKSWLWHRQLSHFNFSILNKLAKDGLARGIPKLKFQKVRNVRTDNETKFVNQTLYDFYKKVSISHQTSVARTPQQNGVKAINTTCYTQNRSLIRLHYNKSSYELMHEKKPDLSFLHVFSSLCYPTNDSEHLGKLNAKAGINIFVGYAPAKKPFRIYNRRTRKIMETTHVTFDELTAMASEQFGSGPGLQSMTPTTTSSVLVADAPRAVDTTESPVSTSIDLDAPSASVVDLTLFIRKAGNDLILVQIYVGDIIFASTNTALCNEFANLMTTKFKMSMMGQMSFFIGLPISQNIPMVEKNKLDEDLQGTPVDATHYRGTIGSLMYLTSHRPDLIYAVCLCARYQAKPTEKHLNVVKRIF